MNWRSETQQAGSSQSTLGALLSMMLVVSGGVASAAAPSPSPAPKVLDLIWEKATPWEWLSTPTVADSTFYLMVKFGTLTEMSIADGRVVREIAPPEAGSYERPVIDGTSIFLSCGNDNVTAFDRSTLQVAWSTYVFPRDSVDCCGMHVEWQVSPPTVAQSRVFFASQDGNLYALDRANGAVKWKRRIVGGGVAAPLVLGEIVYAMGFDSWLMALASETGTLLWFVPLGESFEFAVAKAAGPLIYCAGTGGTIFCVDSTTQGLSWRRTIGTQLRGQISASATLICAAGGQGIYGLDPVTGDTKWRRDVSGEGPTEANGRIYCFSASSELLVLDAETGATLASYKVGPAGFSNGPVVVGDRILAAARGVIYCFADVDD